jgi:hypothetical protein
MRKPTMQRRSRSCFARRWRSALAGVAFAGSLAACSSERDATEKRLAELRDEMTRVQNTADRLEDRVSALEVGAVARSAATEPAPAAAAPVYRPRLKVVHVTPESPNAEPERENPEQERSTGDGR